jgi:hypothetical protein
VLTFFPDPYEDELLYSTLARYHYYSGNVGLKDTLVEIFGVDTTIPTVELPNRLDYFSNHFSKQGCYTSDYFITKHTVLPYYHPFLPVIRQNQIQNGMKKGNVHGLYTSAGIVSGSVCKRVGLSYCPLCSEQDVYNYGESYFRRSHQLQGIFVCYRHGCLLKQFPLTTKEKSRIEFIRLDHKIINYHVEYEKNENRQEQLLRLANSANALLRLNPIEYNQGRVHQRYLNLLDNKKFLTCTRSVKQRDLHEQFTFYYGHDLLHKLESKLDEENEYNWLKLLTRKVKRVVHPLRHLLLIQFLSGSVESFFNYTLTVSHPFGVEPYYCLNPVAEHYRERVVNDCKVTADYKTRQPVGTVSCSCGFIYSRRGPDQHPEDQCRVGRVKSFGHVWENRLIQLLHEKQYALRELARKMGCDPKTVLKYSSKLGLNSRIPSKHNLKLDQKNSVGDSPSLDHYREQYKSDILNLVMNHPQYSRQEVRNHLKKQYAWFYRHDREWLDLTLPKKKQGSHGKDDRVDWAERDKQLIKEIEVIYEKLLCLEKPIRITKSLIGTKLGKKTLLEKHLERLLKSQTYLYSILESVEQFQVRRIKVVCQQLFIEKGIVKKWEVVRRAGLKSNYSWIVEDFIQGQLEKYLKMGITYDSK